MSRTDTHRPAEFDPADYRVIDYIDNKAPNTGEIYLAWLRMGKTPEEAQQIAERARKSYEAKVFEHFPNWQTAGAYGIHQCNHCGHNPIRWVAVVEHIPTGGKLAFGEICADRCELPGRDAFKVKFLKTKAQKEAEAFKKLVAEATWRNDNLEIAQRLDQVSLDYDSRDSDFLMSLKQALIKYGSLTERQTEAMRRVITREREQAERRAAEQAALENVEELRSGRQDIEGTILSTKYQIGNYGETLKMLVKQDDGTKVWGTVPGNIAREIGAENLKGHRVSFTATVTVSNDDKHFGFFKRPTDARVMREEVA